MCLILYITMLIIKVLARNKGVVKKDLIKGVSSQSCGQGVGKQQVVIQGLRWHQESHSHHRGQPPWTEQCREV